MNRGGSGSAALAARSVSVVGIVYRGGGRGSRGRRGSGVHVEARPRTLLVEIPPGLSGILGNHAVSRSRARTLPTGGSAEGERAARGRLETPLAGGCDIKTFYLCAIVRENAPRSERFSFVRTRTPNRDVARSSILSLVSAKRNALTAAPVLFVRTLSLSRMHSKFLRSELGRRGARREN